MDDQKRVLREPERVRAVFDLNLGGERQAAERQRRHLAVGRCHERRRVARPGARSLAGTRVDESEQRVTTGAACNRSVALARARMRSGALSRSAVAKVT